MIRFATAALCAAALLASCAGLPPVPPPGPAASSTFIASEASDTLAALTAAEGITCVTTTSAAGYCWGDVGDEDGTPVRVLLADGTPARVRSLAPAPTGICAVTPEGAAWCHPGATGGWMDSAGAPVPVPPACGSRACIVPLPLRGALPPGAVRGVVRGTSHACALVAGGAAYCWGHNRMGQLGDGTWAADATGSEGPISRAPAAIAGGLRFSQMSAREWLTCGVAVHDRGVYCWGYGQSGQTGDSAVMQSCAGELPYSSRVCSSAVPVRVLPDSVPGAHDQPSRIAFTRVSSGGRLACAIDTAGRVFCWGDNYRCALGRCRRDASPRGQLIPLPGRAVEVHAGYGFACARTADARVFCWGDNARGQLGSLASINAGPDGGPPDYRDADDEDVGRDVYLDDPCFRGGRCSPAASEVSPGRRWHALAVGSDHACALADDGAVHCWGAAGPALGPAPRIVTCENRSPTWEDEPCQPSPAPVPGLPRLAPPTAPPAGARAVADPPDVRATRVLASRDELRIVFPRETADAWGWSELADPAYRPAYHWGLTIQGMDGPRTLWLNVERRPGEGARRFGSLAELVAAESPRLCVSETVGECRMEGVTAAVEDGSVVLALRDPAAVARLAGLRPEWAYVRHTRPDATEPWRMDSVRVEYVDPPVPMPDSAAQAEAAAARRRYEASIRSVTREISAPSHGGGESWLAVGDSVPFHVGETMCHLDLCGGGAEPLAAAGWMVADSTVVRVRPWAAAWRMPVATVVARRTGRTRVRITGLAGPSDTLPSSRPPPRELEVTVIVTEPVARVELTPRIRSAVAGRPVRIRARAFDVRGRVIAGAPVEVNVREDRFTRGLHVRDTGSVTFESPGQRRVIASFGGRADTLVVEVAPEPEAAGPGKPEARVEPRDAAPRTTSASGGGDAGDLRRPRGRPRTRCAGA